MGGKIGVKIVATAYQGSVQNMFPVGSMHYKDLSRKGVHRVNYGPEKDGKGKSENPINGREVFVERRS